MTVTEILSTVSGQLDRSLEQSDILEGKEETKCNMDTSSKKSLDVQVISEIKNEAIDENANNYAVGEKSIDIVAEEMIQAEKECHKQQEEEIATDRREAMAELDKTIKEQRSARLHHLLEKSNFYSKFLLDRMETQKIQQKEQKEKEKFNEFTQPSDKVEIKTEEKTEEKTESRVKRTQRCTPPKSVEVKQKNSKKNSGGIKRKHNQSHHDMSDVIDNETLQKAAKQQKLSDSNKNEDSAFKDTAPSNLKEEQEKGSLPDLQPKLVTGGLLRGYQLEGVEWLKGLFENGINGILADEMGLGKTIQCISLIAYIIEKGVKGPFLIVAPLSTLPNWVSEFQRFAPEINTLLYHGSKERRPHLRRKVLQVKGKEFKTAPAVITSYEIVMVDRQYLQGIPWKFIIVDEGHRLKNLNCKLIRELKSIKSANRLLLTGTPLQNNLAELWSLLNFLLPDIFDDLNSFQAWFDFSEVREEGGYEKIVAKEEEKAILQKLHSILTPFLLRRLKTDVELTIPPKKEVLVYAPFTQKQQDYYKEILDKTIYQNLEKKHLGKTKESKTVSVTKSGRPSRKSAQQTDYKWLFSADLSDDDDISTFIDAMQKRHDRKKMEEQKALEKKMSNQKTAILNLTPKSVLMMLRKCCNHPYLLEYPIDPITNDFVIDENIVTCSGKMLLLDRMLPELISRGHKVLIFSQMTKMLDIIQDYCWLRKLKLSRLDGSMSVEERQEQITQFHNDKDVSVFLLSTRAGGLGINLAVADTVILYDSDWNPQGDQQAQDRAHRIGQTKPVVVYRFITANTIDQRMLETAKSKRKLEKMVIHKGRFKGNSNTNALSPQELLRLLESNDHVTVSTNKDLKHVINNDALKMLLDRTKLFKNSKETNDSAEIDISNENSGQQSCLFELVDNTEDDLVL